MKNPKNYIFIILLLLTFFIGRYSTQYENKIPEGAITIDQNLCNWGLSNNNAEEPATFTIFIRNTLDERIKGNVNFSLKLDGKGIDENYIRDIVKLFGAEQFTTESQKTPKFAAISEYIRRGMKLPNGLNYEPITPHDNINYISSVIKPIDLNPNESTQITLNFKMPPRMKGYAFEMIQK